MIEGNEAAASRAVMRGAEGEAGVDLEGEAPMRHFAPVVTAMHQETAGAHRAAQALGFRHPILWGKRLDPDLAKLRPWRSGLDQKRQPVARRLFSVVCRNLGPVATALEQGHGHCRWCLGGFERRSNAPCDIGRSLDTGDIGVGRRFRHRRLKDTYKRIGRLPNFYTSPATELPDLSRETPTRFFVLAAFASAMFLATIPTDANAVVCARGLFRAGCAGHGAVVVRRPAVVCQTACCG